MAHAGIHGHRAACLVRQIEALIRAANKNEVVDSARSSRELVHDRMDARVQRSARYLSGRAAQQDIALWGMTCTEGR